MLLTSANRLVYRLRYFSVASKVLVLLYVFLITTVSCCYNWLFLYKRVSERGKFILSTMQQSKTHMQAQRNSADHCNGELDPQHVAYSLGYVNANANVRSSEQNISEVKPVRNYSIQTGEEFAFEFMHDRVNPSKKFVSYVNGDPLCTPSYLDLKGILGISHTGSESGPDISVVEKGSKVLEPNNSSPYENKSYYVSARSFPRTSSDYNNYQTLAYTLPGASDGSSIKLKILCSFGGKIIPRPSDGKLRYVGGETRMIRINKDIAWQELLQKTSAIYDQTYSIKYQLPGEDLDALVSVSSDEDLQNMMEECKVLEDGEGSNKLRLFLFSISDLDDAHFSIANSHGGSEFQYVVAVNGMDMGLRKSSTLHGMASCSANNLDELDGSIVEETNRAAAGYVGAGTFPLADFDVSLSTTEPSQLVLPNTSNPSATDSHFYHGQMLHYNENRQQSMQYKLHPDHLSPVDGAVQWQFHGHVGQQKGFVEQLLEGANKEMQLKEAKLKVGGTAYQEGGSASDQLLVNDHLFSSKRSNDNIKDFVPVDEASIVFPNLDRESPLMSSKNEEKAKDHPQVMSLADAANSDQVGKPSGDYYAGSGIATESGPIDLSYFEPSASSHSVFRSERIPREQAELLYRLSKSDNSCSSQFLMTHSHADILEPELIAESVQRSQTEKSNMQIEQGISADHPGFVDSQTTVDGQMTLSKMKQTVPNSVDAKDDDHKNQGLIADRDMSRVKYNAQNLLVDDIAEAKSEVSFVNRVDSGKHPEHPVCSVPEAQRVDKVVSETMTDNAHGHSSAWIGSSTKDINHGETSDASRPEQPDILIDINDRFPRDFLSDIFSKAILSNSPADTGPLQKDGAGMSLNIEKHEPKHWSFFQKLAGNDFARKDVSLVDQGHTGYLAGLPKVDEDASVAYCFDPLTQEGICLGHVNTGGNFGEDDRKESPCTNAAEAVVSHSDYHPSNVQISEAIQYDDLTDHTRLEGSEYEDGQIDIGLPNLDPFLVDIDIDSLQLINNKDLEELRELGSGTFGTVYHGKWRGTDVAIKRIKKSCFIGRSSEQERLTIEFWREAEILSKLHHPNVVAFYGVVQDGPGGILATVAEYMVDGSLRHVLLQNDRHLDRRKRLIIAMDAAFGMEYLHSKNIVHFDLKCDNLLVNLKDSSQPICKVGDFGLSKIKRNTLVSGGVRGSLPWMAPELLNGSSNKVSEKVDVFSFGIVLWEILTGEEPYANMHYGAIIGGIVNNTLRPSIPSFCDPEWRNLMEQCWAPNPVVRPSFTEIAGRLRGMSAAAQARTPVNRASN
ncbi:uncharacterized protein [Coffea arabica]|uniref:Uncharacterized protein LOC113690371 n=1 Tax=Coffea arabica TaxID=13443 RepID=A0A6P6SEU3_COFAR|nr:uncharacterized protein LOC113690371 [Coffea arabica]